jgi:hypothetical protein
MNLLNYLPKEVIEFARYTIDHDPIRVYAPDNPSDMRRMVQASPDLRMKFFFGSGRCADATDLLSLHALGETIRDGAKVIKPSAETCQMLAHVDLNIHMSDYAQPYEGMGVVIPNSVVGTSKDLLAACHWEPGLGIHVATYIGDLMIYQAIGPHWPHTIEEHFGVNDVFEENAVVDDPRKIGRVISRIVLNLGLFGVERGVREVPLDPKAQRRRRRAKHEARFAELAARDAQEVVVQDLDLFLGTSSPSGSGSEAGWHQGLHRRRGHWKMQPHGTARSERKRIYVHSYLVKAMPGSEVHTTLNWKPVDFGTVQPGKFPA